MGGVKMNDIAVRRMIQKDIAGEHAAIGQYNRHIASISDPKIKRKLEHIRDQEMHHVKELESML
jgi:rubrerythrin